MPHGRRAPAHVSRRATTRCPSARRSSGLRRPARRRRRHARDHRQRSASATMLDAGDGDDVLTGGHDADTLVGGPGADRIDGGAGADLLSFAGAHGRRDRRSRRRGRTSDGDTFKGIERIEGGEGADRLLGGSRADEFSGRGGADILRGGGGGDTLYGELGADRIDGGAGEDSISGDPPQGDDYYTPILKLSRDVLRGGPGRPHRRLRRRQRARRRPGDDRSRAARTPTAWSAAGSDCLDGGDAGDSCSAGPATAPRRPRRQLRRGGADRLFGGAGLRPAAGRSGARRHRRARRPSRSRRLRQWPRRAPGSTRKTACGLAKGCGPVRYTSSALIKRSHTAAPRTA